MATTRALLCVALLTGLAACGNEADGGAMGGLPLKGLAQAALAGLKGAGGAQAPAATPAAPDAAQVAEARRALEEAGLPLYIVQNPDLGLLAYFGKYGQNGEVTTWATPDYISVSLKGGMVVATRGLGADIMSSDLPLVADIRRGQGQTQRRYFYLDAADGMQQMQFTCTLQDRGAETITLIGKDYSTRRIDETCRGPRGAFVNSYWFDSGANLRQSSQLLAPGLANLLVQKIID